MLFWLVLGFMTALAALLVVWPLLGRREPAFGRRDYELEVYRAQLGELEREVARGLIDPGSAKGARLELERRMLAADALDRGQPRPTRSATGRGLSIAAAVALSLLGAGLYGWLGRPDLLDQPLASRETEQPALAGNADQPAAAPPVEEMVARLEAQTQANPADLEGWLRLARAYELTRQPDRAADAYARAIDLEDGIAPLQAAFAEASIIAAGGIVTEAARAALDKALALDPTEPRARFYKGVALQQRGEQQAALDAWVGLARDSSADAPWLGPLEQRIAALARELGTDVSALLPERPAAPGPPLPPMTAQPAPPLPPAAAQPVPEPLPEEPAALEAEARALAARLERAPKDWQGWIRLAQARAALNQMAAAEAALERGAELYANAPFVLQQFQAALADLGDVAQGAPVPRRGPTTEQMQAAAEMAPEDREAMIRGMVEGLAARLESEPDDLQGWLMLGRSWRVLNERDKSIDAFRKAAGLLPQGSAERAQVEAEIQSLEAGG